MEVNIARKRKVFAPVFSEQMQMITSPHSYRLCPIVIYLGSMQCLDTLNYCLESLNIKYFLSVSEERLKLDMNDQDKITDQNTQLECRILLAEDMPDNQRLVSYYLKQAGAEVFIAEDGQIAYDLALEARDHGFPFDVILMDIQMPSIDGNEATKKLRDAGYTGPIIAITAHTNTHDRDSCVAAGCDNYTTKPVDRDKLIELVAHYASQQKKKKCLAEQAII